MTAALLSTLASVVAVAAVLAVLLVLTLLPFVVTLSLSEQRGLGPVRWGLAAALCSLVGVAVIGVGLRHGLGWPVVGVGAAAAWASPVALLLLGSAPGTLAGARGRRE